MHFETYNLTLCVVGGTLWFVILGICGSLFIGVSAIGRMRWQMNVQLSMYYILKLPQYDMWTWCDHGSEQILLDGVITY